MKSWYAVHVVARIVLPTVMSTTRRVIALSAALDLAMPAAWVTSTIAVG